MNRREFSKTLTANAAILTVAGQSAAAGTPTLYYVDGYHGGTRGHMPAGAWRDILNAMRSRREWKLSFDIEPASWEALRREDPQAYREIQKMLADSTAAARMEIVNGTFAQPFGWANGGESNIRQLLRGLDVIRRNFPRALIDTYAVQEPCWSSCLPQLLRSLGFKYAVLKDPGTAWGGYTAGFDAEVVTWVGPDGTAIPAVPRYACEELRNVWETESVTGSAEFSRKCAAHGIAHPAGNCYQDLGWAAKPKVAGDHIRFVTWREYFQKVASAPVKEWRFSQEDILTTLPWGEKTLQTLAQQVRSAENRVIAAEKMAAMAALRTGSAYPRERLERAWDQVLWAQHHDAWITATTRTGRQAWAFQVAAETMESEEIAAEITAAAAEALSKGAPAPAREPLGPQWIRIFNTQAGEREDLVEINWACDLGTRRAKVLDASGKEAPCQLLRPRKFNARAGGRGRAEEGPPAGVPLYAPGESLNAATVLFRARVPSFGYSTYRIEPVYDDSAPPSWPGASASVQADGTVVLETDLYRLRIDPAKGGAITSLLVKDGGMEFTDPNSERMFNEYRGYFISEKKWCSSVENRASITISERGPVRIRATVSGQVGGRRFQTSITLTQGLRRIDFTARFNYDQETWIGDPWDIKPEDRRKERRRSQNDGRWKLQAFFPVPAASTIHKDAAFDVCRSRNQDTFFQGWDEIKHNIVLHWVDVSDEARKLGLAVLSDHTTAYTQGPGYPLALVLGWGWEGGFWWGKCPLKGVQQLNYSLIPHRGAWDEAGISAESGRWQEPLVAQLMDGAPVKGSETWPLIQVEGTGVEISAVTVEKGRLLVRLFNGAGGPAEFGVFASGRWARVSAVELDGRIASPLAGRAVEGGRTMVRLAMPRFGIRTLRFDPAQPGGKMAGDD